MRLSSLMLNQGQSRKAEELCQLTLDKIDHLIRLTKNERLRGKAVDALCVQGYTLKTTGHFGKSLNAFAAVKSRHSLDDPYARLSQAASHYQTSVDLRSNPPEQST